MSCSTTVANIPNLFSTLKSNHSNINNNSIKKHSNPVSPGSKSHSVLDQSAIYNLHRTNNILDSMFPHNATNLNNSTINSNIPVAKQQTNSVSSTNSNQRQSTSTHSTSFSSVSSSPFVNPNSALLHATTIPNSLSASEVMSQDLNKHSLNLQLPMNTTTVPPSTYSNRNESNNLVLPSLANPLSGIGAAPHLSGYPYQIQPQQQQPPPPQPQQQYHNLHQPPAAHQSQQQPQQNGHVRDASQIEQLVPMPAFPVKPKRLRRKSHEVERLYKCTYRDCSKSYGTLNHLNTHIVQQKHGEKRHPNEFKTIRNIIKQRNQARKDVIENEQAAMASGNAVGASQNGQQQYPPNYSVGPNYQYATGGTGSSAQYQQWYGNQDNYSYQPIQSLPQQQRWNDSYLNNYSATNGAYGQPQQWYDQQQQQQAQSQQQPQQQYYDQYGGAQTQQAKQVQSGQYYANSNNSPPYQKVYGQRDKMEQYPDYNTTQPQPQNQPQSQQSIRNMNYPSGYSAGSNSLSFPLSTSQNAYGGLGLPPRDRSHEEGNENLK